MKKTILLLSGFLFLAPSIGTAQSAGQAKFLANCSACHQANAQGIKGAFPALAGSPFVQGDPKIVVSTVLNGRAGMPAWKGELNDTDIAIILSYVRSNFGNKAAPIAPAFVSQIRKGGAATKARGLQAH